MIRIYRRNLSFDYRLAEVNILICFDQRARTLFVRCSKYDCQLSRKIFTRIYASSYLFYDLIKLIVNNAVLKFNKTVVKFPDYDTWQMAPTCYRYILKAIKNCVELKKKSLFEEILVFSSNLFQLLIFNTQNYISTHIILITIIRGNPTCTK